MNDCCEKVSNPVATATAAKGGAWLAALRPRTLPLAIASIATGSFLAAADGVFDSHIATLTMLTALLLQTLSNLANDYGDSVHGADSLDRKGPSRAVQSGLISAKDMRRATLFMAILATLCGSGLIWLALHSQGLLLITLFTLLGAAAIWAAINYTAGSKPYGYAGFGDLSVFLFFGLTGVLGTYFLQAGTLDALSVLPAISVGVLSVAVLNINNIRDMESDAKAGKYSIPVRIGLARARRYHWFLLLAGPIASLVYVALLWQSVWQLLFLVTLPLLVVNGRAIDALPREKLDPMLKQMVLSALLFVLAFGLGQVLS